MESRGSNIFSSNVQTLYHLTLLHALEKPTTAHESKINAYLRKYNARVYYHVH